MNDEASSLRRLLVVLPNWVGDVVLASPVLAALRAHFADTRIAYLLRAPLRPLVAGAGWHDEEIVWPAARGVNRLIGPVQLAQNLRARRFDAVLLLTNSFRSALIAWMAGVHRRVGYARDGRSLLLTDRVRPLRRDGEFVPSPITPAYARLAEQLGCPVHDLRLRLAVSEDDERGAARLLEHYGIAPRQTYAVINPGAAFGAAKCWLPERFAEVCVRLHREHGMPALLVGAPGEHALLERIGQMAAPHARAVLNPGTTLGSLRALIRGAALLVCNDSGPRHFGNALRIPTVTIFGPTHQEWTATDAPGEVRLQAAVPCGPCQLRTCPLDHRCMTLVSTDMVMEAVRTALARVDAGGAPEARAAAADDGHVAL